MLAGASAGTTADKQHMAKFAMFSFCQAGSLVWTLWVVSKVGLVSVYVFNYWECLKSLCKVGL